MVPSSAVKTQNGASYVQAFDPPLKETGGAQGITSDTAPRQIPVEVGISDDTKVEVISGLEEGEQIVTRIISGTAAAAATSGSGGGGGFGGGGPPGF
jgi:HlyD family secretion protein